MSDWTQARAVLQQGILAQAFPGASYGVWHEDEVVALETVGHFTYEADSPAVEPNTIFDLASVSKVLPVTALAMRLWQREGLPLDLRVAEVLPDFAIGDESKRQVTLKMLLAHTSGLPAHRKLYELPKVLAAGSAKERAAAALHACLAMPLESEPGTRAEYSDIGFILLGEALLRLTGAANLQDLSAAEVFRPLGLADTCYLPPMEWRDRIAPTRDWTWRKRVLKGEVQDENCALLGGIAAHAGVFSTCGDLVQFGASLCQPGEFFEQRTIDFFCTRVAGSRALGWDTPSVHSQSGRYFSSNSVGHLGYTGTSLWIDLERRVVVTLLSNRVYTAQGPANHGIQQVRPAFHDAVMRTLGLALAQDE